LSAVYGGTAQSPGRVKSNTVRLIVAGATASATRLTATANAQNPNNYDFTATVGGFGFPAPGGVVNFTDTTTGTHLGAASMDAHSVMHGFKPPQVFPAGGGPAQSVIADFNGDGFADVATVNASFSISVMAVFLGKGDGSFAAPVTYPTAVFTSGILTADFNQDGIPDIAAMSQNDGTDGDVSVFLGNGDGSFSGPVHNNLGNFPVSIALGDFDRDGILDIVTADYFANAAYISLGNGDGTFKTAVPYPAGVGPYSVTTGDFNDDGFVDVGVANGDGNSMSVLLGKGDGTLRTEQLYPTGRQPEFVAAGDVNGDGKVDLLICNFASASVGVFLGRGDGSFETQVTYTVGGADDGLAIADLDGDGVPDIAVSYYQPPKVGILRGRGDGTFAAVRDFATGQTQGYELSVADLNGDGTPDVVNDDITSSISVLLNGTAAKATITDVAVPGTSNDTEEIVATYSGNGRYVTSKSKPLEVKGSGAK